MTASLIARCGGAASFFGLTRDLVRRPADWIGKIQAADPAQMQALQSHAAAAAVLDDRRPGRLPAVRGDARRSARPRASACLADQAEVNQLVQMNSDAVSTYSIPGTPTFLINGDAGRQRPRAGSCSSPRSRQRWPAKHEQGGGLERCASAG